MTILTYNFSERMCKELEAAHIPCTLILDSAVGYVMEQVDFVMVGAEGVVESGGIVNKVGDLFYKSNLKLFLLLLFCRWEVIQWVFVQEK